MGGENGEGGVNRPRRDVAEQEAEPLVLSKTPEQQAAELTAQIEGLRKNMFPPKKAIETLEAELTKVLNQIEAGK